MIPTTQATFNALEKIATTNAKRSKSAPQKAQAQAKNLFNAQSGTQQAANINSKKGKISEWQPTDSRIKKNQLESSNVSLINNTSQIDESRGKERLQVLTGTDKALSASELNFRESLRSSKANAGTPQKPQARSLSASSMSRSVKGNVVTSPGSRLYIPVKKELTASLNQNLQQVPSYVELGPGNLSFYEEQSASKGWDVDHDAGSRQHGTFGSFGGNPTSRNLQPELDEAFNQEQKQSQISEQAQFQQVLAHAESPIAHNPRNAYHGSGPRQRQFAAPADSAARGMERGNRITPGPDSFLLNSPFTPRSTRQITSYPSQKPSIYSHQEKPLNFADIIDNLKNTDKKNNNQVWHNLVRFATNKLHEIAEQATRANSTAEMNEHLENLKAHTNQLVEAMNLEELEHEGKLLTAPYPTPLSTKKLNPQAQISALKKTINELQQKVATKTGTEQETQVDKPDLITEETQTSDHRHLTEALLKDNIKNLENELASVEKKLLILQKQQFPAGASADQVLDFLRQQRGTDKSLQDIVNQYQEQLNTWANHQLPAEEGEVQLNPRPINKNAASGILEINLNDSHDIESQRGNLDSSFSQANGTLEQNLLEAPNNKAAFLTSTSPHRQKPLQKSTSIELVAPPITKAELLERLIKITENKQPQQSQEPLPEGLKRMRDRPSYDTRRINQDFMELENADNDALKVAPNAIGSQPANQIIELLHQLKNFDPAKEPQSPRTLMTEEIKSKVNFGSTFDQVKQLEQDDMKFTIQQEMKANTSISNRLQNAINNLRNRFSSSPIIKKESEFKEPLKNLLTEITTGLSGRFEDWKELITKNGDSLINNDAIIEDLLELAALPYNAPDRDIYKKIDKLMESLSKELSNLRDKDIKNTATDLINLIASEIEKVAPQYAEQINHANPAAVRPSKPNVDNFRAACANLTSEEGIMAALKKDAYGINILKTLSKGTDAKAQKFKQLSARLKRYNQTRSTNMVRIAKLIGLSAVALLATGGSAFAIGRASKNPAILPKDPSNSSNCSDSNITNNGNYSNQYVEELLANYTNSLQNEQQYADYISSQPADTMIYQNEFEQGLNTTAVNNMKSVMQAGEDCKTDLNDQIVENKNLMNGNQQYANYVGSQPADTMIYQNKFEQGLNTTAVNNMKAVMQAGEDCKTDLNDQIIENKNLTDTNKQLGQDNRWLKGNLTEAQSSLTNLQQQYANLKDFVTYQNASNSLNRTLENNVPAETLTSMENLFTRLSEKDLAINQLGSYINQLKIFIGDQQPGAYDGSNETGIEQSIIDQIKALTIGNAGMCAQQLAQYQEALNGAINALDQLAQIDANSALSVLTTFSNQVSNTNPLYASLYAKLIPLAQRIRSCGI